MVVILLSYKWQMPAAWGKLDFCNCYSPTGNLKKTRKKCPDRDIFYSYFSDDIDIYQHGMGMHRCRQYFLDNMNWCILYSHRILVCTPTCRKHNFPHICVQYLNHWEHLSAKIWYVFTYGQFSSSLGCDKAPSIVEA